MVFRDQVSEVRNADSRLHVARKDHWPDEWDPPIEPYDPYGSYIKPGDWDVVTDDEGEHLKRVPTRRSPKPTRRHSDEYPTRKK